MLLQSFLTLYPIPMLISADGCWRAESCPEKLLKTCKLSQLEVYMQEVEKETKVRQQAGLQSMTTTPHSSHLAQLAPRAVWSALDLWATLKWRWFWFTWRLAEQRWTLWFGRWKESCTKADSFPHQTMSLQDELNNLCGWNGVCVCWSHTAETVGVLALHLSSTICTGISLDLWVDLFSWQFLATCARDQVVGIGWSHKFSSEAALAAFSMWTRCCQITRGSLVSQRQKSQKSQRWTHGHERFQLHLPMLGLTVMLTFCGVKMC